MRLWRSVAPGGKPVRHPLDAAAPAAPPAQPRNKLLLHLRLRSGCRSAAGCVLCCEKAKMRERCVCSQLLRINCCVLHLLALHTAALH